MRNITQGMFTTWRKNNWDFGTRKKLQKIKDQKNAKGFYWRNFPFIEQLLIHKTRFFRFYRYIIWRRKNVCKQKNSNKSHSSKARVYLLKDFFPVPIQKNIEVGLFSKRFKYPMYRILLDLHLKLPYFSTIFLLAQSSIKICTFFRFYFNGVQLNSFLFHPNIELFRKNERREETDF